MRWAQESFIIVSTGGLGMKDSFFHHKGVFLVATIPAEK